MSIRLSAGATDRTCTFAVPWLLAGAYTDLKSLARSLREGSIKEGYSDHHIIKWRLRSSSDSHIYSITAVSDLDRRSLDNPDIAP